MSRLLYFGIALPFLLAAFEYFLAPSTDYVPTKLGIRQPSMKVEGPLTKLINEEKGTLALNGWGSDVENKILINNEYATPISSTFMPINKIRQRSWNYFLLYTPTHVFQFIMVDILGGVLCTNSIVAMEKADVEGSAHLVADMFNCGSFAKNTLSLG